uniref:Uncharacterized protein n=1 Tax=Daphnia galeata TaxID=27404 RepID=A0A8J2WL01_9CRUS|nr:unnamed protein product [Daphnia galeata]
MAGRTTNNRTADTLHVYGLLNYWMVGHYFLLSHTFGYPAMPRVKRVNSLFDMSIDFITENMDKFCKKMSTVNEIDVVKQERSTNVFSLLPSYFIEEIIKVLGEKGYLKKQFLEHLMTPRLHTLDFSSMCVRTEISDLLRLAAIRCPDLETLMLFHPTYFLDNEDYLNFIPKFTELQVLDISYSRAGDTCLGILGSYCKELRELYAEHSSVTDSGLQELFINGQCKLINTLDLDWTNVTNAGIQLALDSLPLLRVLHNQSTVECLVKVHALSRQELGWVPSLHLYLLLFSPSLAHVRLSDCDSVSDEILMMISIIHRFHCLEHFEISNCNFVTNKGIDVFMQDSNALKKIELKWCDKVTRKNICDWKKKAEENNWQLFISAQLTLVRFEHLRSFQLFVNCEKIFVTANMPQIKSPKTLFQTCLDYVTNHMDEWGKKSPKLNGTEDIELIEKRTNPFYELPSMIIEEIISCLRKKNLLETNIIELLISPQLRTLDFSSMCRENKVSGLLHLATIISPDLKNLQLSHSTYHLDNDHYISFIPKFSKLEVLDISYSKKGDSCLHLLGKHCKDLRVLYAKFSTVSDDGLEGLCVTGQCKSIQTLDLFQSSVSTNGVLLAIQNLPALTILSHKRMVDVLADAAEATADKKLKLPQLSLSSLCLFTESGFRTQHYRVGSLALALSLCSSITTLDLRIPKELTDHELQALPLLKNLRIFRMAVAERHITFDGGVVPLLKSFGNSLKSLELSFLNVVNIRAIIEYCVNLNTLTLLCNNSYSMAWPEEERKSSEEKRIKMEEPNLKKLEELNIIHFGKCVEKEIIITLLSSSSLKSIYLKGCCLLTDDVLLEVVANSHSFQNLETLEISECKSVSKKGINLLMKEGNSLKKLDVRGCFRILPKHVASWTRKATRKNWDLLIDYNVPVDCDAGSESDDSESDDEEPAGIFFNLMFHEFLQAAQAFHEDASDEEESDEYIEHDESGDEEEDVGDEEEDVGDEEEDFDEEDVGDQYLVFKF